MVRFVEPLLGSMESEKSISYVFFKKKLFWTTFNAPVSVEIGL